MSERIISLFSRLRGGAARLSSQVGAEVVQVIMIMGIMALLIGAIFYTGGLNTKIKQLGTKVSNCVSVISGGGTGSCV